MQSMGSFGGSLLGSGVLQADQAKVADIFPDGSVSGLDLARLRQMIVGA